MGFPLTEEQRAAVEDRGGGLLVSAAAGSGKTRVLVERLLSRVEESLTEHLAILDCIRRRDLARLTELLENHIQY